MIHRRSATAKLSLLIYLWVALSGDGAIVLCIGSDGHVALEAASVLCCSHSHSVPSAAVPVVLVEDTDGCCTSAMTCGPCTDLPISVSFLPSNSATSSAAKAKVSPIAKWIAPHSSPVAGTVFMQGHFSCLPPTAPNPAISSLRSVVLLI